MPLSRDLRPIYTAAGETAAATALEAFAERWKAATRRSCGCGGRTGQEFVPFLVFLPEVRRVIYTTNLIESMNPGCAR